jgi:hypothetical protein
MRYGKRFEPPACGITSSTGARSQDEVLERMGRLDVVLVLSMTTRTWKEQFGRMRVQAMAQAP